MDLNYGKDIFQIYTTPAKLFGNYIGQGLTTNMYYLEGKVAFLLNPKYNLRIELGGIFRQEQNTQFNDKTTWLTIRGTKFIPPLSTMISRVIKLIEFDVQMCGYSDVQMIFEYLEIKLQD